LTPPIDGHERNKEKGNPSLGRVLIRKYLACARHKHQKSEEKNSETFIIE